MSRPVWLGEAPILDPEGCLDLLCTLDSGVQGCGCSRCKLTQHTHVQVHIHAHKHARTCAHMHAHTHIHTFTRTHTHPGEIDGQAEEIRAAKWQARTQAVLQQRLGQLGAVKVCVCVGVYACVGVYVRVCVCACVHTHGSICDLMSSSIQVTETPKDKPQGRNNLGGQADEMIKEGQVNTYTSEEAQPASAIA
eukprot:1162132-Pelagomonas_calceolata.AAC.5